MLYYLFEILEKEYQLPGAGLFQFLSFRAALSMILSLFFSLVFGQRIINYLSKLQIGESIRDLGLKGQKEKSGTPTMGGLIIIFSTVFPVILLAKLESIYIILLLITTIWMGIIGGIDDYVKVFLKNKKGLKGWFKIIGQIILGLFIGATLYFHPDITVRQKAQNNQIIRLEAKNPFGPAEKAFVTNMPLLKNNAFNYSDLIDWIDESLIDYTWIIFIPIVIFIITAVSNGANLTDGLDGLTAGISAIIVFALGIFAWFSGNFVYSDYLNIIYIPEVGEITIFIAAFLGALVGFLWFNTFPASIFMGDTGSLTIGGLIAVIALIVRKELLIPLLCGVFFIETLSVIIQVGFFKYTKRKTGIGNRLFLMSPIHHHFQKKGFHESKIVSRFWIIGILLAILSIVTLKIR
ncbi:MAG: phospho-N-acetylmuramoyl-pentapeptide-transferase [Flavobacteriaceae bacterium]|nr:phospho-N-acetylmuramoyl-pentapeptide-transferase [Flavobacteriaceae bacterium]|tara:strand:- start:8541 stop:9761 length:1221 start_codon:yes stop_codon:yes gene_type:complete